LRLGRAANLLARHSPQAEFARMGERCAGLAGRLARVRSTLVPNRRAPLEALGKRLEAALRAQLALQGQTLRARRERLVMVDARLRAAIAANSQRKAERLGALAQLFASLGYKSVLARGFALVRDGEGTPLRAASGLAPGMAISIEFSDGRVAAVTGEGGASAAEPAKPRPRPARGGPSGGGSQGSLF